MPKRELTELERATREERYRQKLAEWDRRLREETEATERSERLTAADFSVYIGPCER